MSLDQVVDARPNKMLTSSGQLSPPDTARHRHLLPEFRDCLSLLPPPYLLILLHAGQSTELSPTQSFRQLQHAPSPMTLPTLQTCPEPRAAVPQPVLPARRARLAVPMPERRKLTDMMLQRSLLCTSTRPCCGGTGPASLASMPSTLVESTS